MARDRISDYKKGKMGRDVRRELQREASGKAAANTNEGECPGRSITGKYQVVRNGKVIKNGEPT